MCVCSIGNSGGGGSGQVVYIIVSVVVLLVVCVATAAVIIFLACYPSRRNRKNRVSQFCEEHNTLHVCLLKGYNYYVGYS